MSKPGSGGIVSQENSNAARRARLRDLVLHTVDLAKDPYLMRNHLGSHECKLCLTLHMNGANYLAHTQGRRHQYNMKKRAAKLSKNNNNKSIGKQKAASNKYKFTKQRAIYHEK